MEGWPGFGQQVKDRMYDVVADWVTVLQEVVNRQAVNETKSGESSVDYSEPQGETPNSNAPSSPDETQEIHGAPDPWG